MRQIEEENENKIKSETTKISIISPKTQNHVATLLTNFSSLSVTVVYVAKLYRLG